MAETDKKSLDLELKIFAALESLHSKVDTVTANVRERNDEVLKIQQRQNRHGQKIRRLEGYVFQGPQAPPPLVPAWQPRPRAPSRPEWDPEDTNPHILAPADMVRLGELADRDRKDSIFWRELPRAAFLKGIGMVAALVLTAAFTWLLSRH